MLPRPPARLRATALGSAPLPARATGPANARIVAAFQRVEALPPAASGAFVVGDRGRPSGIIFIEGQRISWIAAAGMGRRLRDILRIHCTGQLPDIAIAELCTRCRAEHLPLADTLAREGYLSPIQLRAAMKQHTAESVLALDAAYAAEATDWPLTWVGREPRGHDPAFAFAAAEVLAAVGAARIEAATSARVDDQLARLESGDCSAVAFALLPGGQPMLIGATSDGGVRVAELGELSDWALAALGASEGFSPRVTHTYARSATSGGAVAWRYEGCAVVAVCTTGAAIARLVAGLEGLRLPMVLSTSLAVLQRIRRGAVALRERRRERIPGLIDGE